MEEQDIFCTAFDSCVVWDDDEDSSTTSAAKKQGETADKAGDSIDIDCTTLTECKWDGMHEHFLSDGVCHDSLPGCYNSKACNYDGGDCCQVTVLCGRFTWSFETKNILVCVAPYLGYLRVPGRLGLRRMWSGWIRMPGPQLDVLPAVLGPCVQRILQSRR